MCPTDIMNVIALHEYSQIVACASEVLVHMVVCIYHNCLP